MSNSLRPPAIIETVTVTDKSFLIFTFFLVAAGLYYFIRMPVVRLDTDLWYHLASGRYILQNGALPRDSFFSFISPARPWVDYYWLFQVVVYKLYGWLGYVGPIMVRALAYAGTVTLIALFLWKKGARESRFIYVAVLFVLYFLFLQVRFENIRPHLFSYFMIVAFVSVLESGNRKGLLLLPIMALFWANLHGIMYPVLLLILLAYGAERVFVRLREKEAFARYDAFFFGLLALSACAVLATPRGFTLLPVPFVSTYYASQYISELTKWDVANMASFQLVRGLPSSMTLLNVMMALVVVALGTALMRKRLRFSHALLLAGGIFLLTRSGRFSYEFVLLSLPVLAANPPGIPLGAGKWRTVLGVCIMVVLAVYPLYVMAEKFGNRAIYPFSERGLPAGVCRFLNHHGLTGNVLNHPNTGGYLQWMLYPRNKIFMDMEVPFLFADEDFFMASNAMSDEAIFRKIVDKYEPSFVSVPITNKKFSALAGKIGPYVPVFFDDEEVLFVHRGRHLYLATEHQLTAIDPFALYGKKVDEIIAGANREAIRRELTAILKVYPQGLTTNHMMGEIYLDDTNHKKAMEHADVLIGSFPESPIGYKLKGKALVGLKRPVEAARLYKLALKRTEATEKGDIYKRMATLLIELGQYQEAYDAAKKGVPVFDAETNFVALYQLGSAALLSGHKNEAAQVLRMGYLKVPEDNQEWKKNYEKLFTALSGKAAQ